MLFQFKRSFSWFLFTFKQSPWQEDFQLFEVIEKVLLDTADYFEKREKEGYVVGVSNKSDVADMRLAAKLIRMKMEEHYWNESIKEKYDFSKRKAAMDKDQRALEIAMKIIAEKGFGWWV